jgi:DNA replication protein DnaC
MQTLATAINQASSTPTYSEPAETDAPEKKFFEPEFNCKDCEDRGWVFMQRGVAECDCKKEKYRATKLGAIPVEYKDIDLSTMMPMKHPKQAKLLPVLRHDPYKSLALIGPNGVGKTAIAFALYRRAVEENRPAIYVLLADLLEDLREAEHNDDHIAAISSTALSSQAKDAAKWLLFIDDFNVGRATPFTGEALFRILNAVYQYHHQLIITAHCSMRTLRAHWEQAGAGYGGSIIRRVEQAHNSLIVDFFAQSA